MKMKHLTPLFALLLCQALSAQVKIGDNPQNIDPASLLELESTEQVLVITRVTTAQMEAIAPSEGALVYNTDEACLFYYSQRWINLCEALGLSFTNEAIVNRDSTIIITEFEDRFNFEVGRIRGGDDTGEFNNIIDFSVTSQDIQNNAINAAKLAPNSVGTEEIEDNAVTGAEIDLNLVRVSTFDNDAGYLITADLVSQDPGNDILEGSVNGVFYDNPDGVVGNEVTGPTDATLVLSGTGIDVDPLTLDVADGAIGTSELADLGVQTGDIAQDAITADKIDASVAGTGLVQNADGALEVDVTEFQGDGTLSSPGGSITLGGIPENALFEDVDIDVAIPELISGESGNSVTTGPDGGLFATDDQDASEVSFDDSAAQLGATLVQDAIDALAASNASDLDTDPTNEFSLTGTGLPGDPGTSAGQTYVDISAGQLFAWDGAVWIAVGGTNAVDNDPDPQNELQDITSTDNTVTITPNGIDFDLSVPPADGSETILNNGTDINITGDGTLGNPYIINSTFTELDDDPNNENQSVTGGVGILVNQVAQNFEIINDAPDLLISLVDGGSGNVNIGGAYPNFTIDVPTLNDGDSDPNNENQSVIAGAGILINQIDQEFEVVNDAPDLPVSLVDGGSGNVNIGGAYPNFTIDVPTLNDGDSDPNNENQTVIAGAGILINQIDQEFEVVNDAPDLPISLVDGGSGNVNIGGAYPNFTIDVPSLIPTGTAGSIFFSDGAGNLLENNAQLFWDNTESKLYVGNRILTETDVKLNVGGTIRTQFIKGASGSPALPTYRFTDNQDTGMYLQDAVGILAFATNEVEAFRIDASQNVGIAQPTPLARLHVGGDIRADGSFISNNTTIQIPDYVFQSYFTGSSNLKSNYQMLSLEEVRNFIKNNHHLPGVSSAKEVEAQGGIVLDETITQNLEKIEELFLYTIEQEDKIKALQKENADLSSDLEALKERMSRIEYLLLQKKEE